MDPTRRAARALAVSLAPLLFAGVMAVVSTLFPIVHGRREPAAGLALFALSIGILMAWPLGVVLSLRANRAAATVEGPAKTLARLAIGLSIVGGLMIGLTCLGLTILVIGLSLH